MHDKDIKRKMKKNANCEISFLQVKISERFINEDIFGAKDDRQKNSHPDKLSHILRCNKEAWDFELDSNWQATFDEKKGLRQKKTLSGSKKTFEIFIN